jgi:hypothetical protein
MGLCNREYENSPISQKRGLCNREYEKYTIFIEIFDFREKILMRDPGIPRNHAFDTNKWVCVIVNTKIHRFHRKGVCVIVNTVRDRAPLSERPGGFFARGISLSLSLS